MKNSRILVISLIICVVVSFVPGVMARTTTIQIAHVHNKEYPAHVALLKYAEYVDKNTNGQLRLEIFPDGSLGSEIQLIERTAVGTVDGCLGYSGALQQYDSSFGVFSVYFLWDNYQVLYDVFNGPIGDTIKDNMAKKQGLRMLGPLAYAGERYLTIRNKPVRKPEDLQGVKIRSLEDKIALSFVESMGAIPTPISFAELYMALQQRIVDGQENGLSQIWWNKFYEQQKYLMLSSHKFTDFVLIINEQKFKSLTAEQREILEKGANEVWAQEVWRLSAAEEQELLAKLQENGMTVIHPDREAFQKRAIAKAYQLEKEGVWPKGLFDKVLAEIERVSKNK